MPYINMFSFSRLVLYIKYFILHIVSAPLLSQYQVCNSFSKSFQPIVVYSAVIKPMERPISEITARLRLSYFSVSAISMSLTPSFLRIQFLNLSLSAFTNLGFD